MCGIAGVVRHGGAVGADPAAALDPALAHRGPDGSGAWRSPAGDALLVHRVPFVDHQLLDAVWPDLGAHPSLMRGKRLPHETLARPLPRAAVDRPKQGFTLPFAKWMSGELQPFVRSGMAHLASSGWIAPAVPDETWRAWLSGVAHWSRPWALGVLGEFLRQM